MAFHIDGDVRVQRFHGFASNSYAYAADSRKHERLNGGVEKIHDFISPALW